MKRTLCFCAQLRKDTSEKGFTALIGLGSGNVVAAKEKVITVYDGNNGRPLTSFNTSSWIQWMRRDPLNPNVFYAIVGDKIVAYDTNTKKEVGHLLFAHLPKDLIN